MNTGSADDASPVVIWSKDSPRVLGSIAELQDPPGRPARNVTTARVSVRAVPAEHGEDRPREDAEVAAEAPVLHVEEVEANRVVPAEIRPSADLPQPGEA